jgi:hypothetical protein
MLRTPSFVVIGVTTVLFAACSSQAPPTSPSLISGRDAVDSGVRTNVGPVAGTASVHNSCHPDVTAPTITSVTATPNSLWPPNHKWINVTVSATATDACSPPAPPPTCSIDAVASNEPVNGLGDGNTAPDWVIVNAGLVQLRAERSGTRRGRTYTITVECTDAAGNPATASTTVTVAHDQRKS